MTLRIIIRSDNAVDNVHLGTPVVTTFKTFDISAPEIEGYLSAGGYNENGSFLVRQIVGVEEIKT